MDIKILKEKMKNMNKKIVYTASFVAALVVLGIGYISFGKENSYAAVPKTEIPIPVSAFTVENRTIDAVHVCRRERSTLRTLPSCPARSWARSWRSR